MSKYRRFVAYVYEYQKQKKGNNRGFVRVENKEGVCDFQINLRCPGLIGQLPCRIYGFVRGENKMIGILLKECVTQTDGVQWEFEVQDGRMGRSQKSLNDFGGMVLLVEGGGFYGTEWDDLGIVPEHFQEEGQEEVTDTYAEEVERTISEGQTQKEEAKNQEAVRSETVQPETVRVEAVQENLETEKEEILPVLRKIPEPDDWEKDEEEEEEGVTVAGVTAEKFEPFEDGEIVECRKIEPEQFTVLHRGDWVLKNNRFLLYGYYHFGYLIVGKIRGRSQYVLGVPGMYDQQERFMANMFGFPHFKQSSAVELPAGKGGYWYRLINPPNFDQGNRS